MLAYESLAKVYDEFMEEVDYKQWEENIIKILRTHDINKGTILDLACGTGKITLALAKKSYEMIGIDISNDMLSIASNTSISENQNILYLNQDIRNFFVNKECSAIISTCDSLNYILEYEDLVAVFKNVKNTLKKAGLFIFDMNTEYKYREILANNNFSDNIEDASFICENEYDENNRINYYYLTIYLKKENNLYERFEEEHIQKAYSIKDVKEALKEADLEFLNLYDADNMKEIKEDTERMLFVARKR